MAYSPLDLVFNDDGMQSLQTVILLAVGVMVATGLRSIWDDGSGGGLRGETVGLFEQLTGETSPRTPGGEIVQEESSGSLAAWGRRRESQKTDPVIDTRVDEETDGDGVRPGFAIVRAKPRKIGDVPVDQADREVIEDLPTPMPEFDPPSKGEDDLLVRIDPWFKPDGGDISNPVY